MVDVRARAYFNLVRTFSSTITGHSRPFHIANTRCLQLFVFQYDSELSWRVVWNSFNIMSKPTAAQWGELDSSDIASINSEDLNANRPNRWQGPESTWRALTEEERSLWTSLKASENQDLSTHLYNAFSLKKRSKDPELAEDLKIEMEDGKEAVWAPPKMWTAWPLAEGKLPREDFVAREADEDEDFTFRRKVEKMPSDDLQEEISATILRAAKRRFLKRKKAWSAVQPSVEEEADDEEDALMKEETEAEASDDEEDDDTEVNDVDSDAVSKASSPKPNRTYDPVVSANEELSYKLLEPSTRHIITKLDSTLRILHHTRASGANGNDESASESEPSEKEEMVVNTAALEPKLKITKRGRPRKAHVPREGESHEEMLVRIARESHRRVPKLKKKEAAIKRQARASEEAAEEAKEADAAFQAWMEKAEESEEAGSSDGKGDDPDKDAFEDWLRQEEADKKNRPKTRQPRQRMALRDWSDVVGAAAIAGFPPDVIARTVQRCANLFGESMSIRSLQEVPHRERGSQLQEYRPEAIHLSDSDEPATESEAEMTLDERRTLSRRNSRMQSRASISPSPASSRSRSRSRTDRSRSRSRTTRSHSASVGPLNYCPVLECERSVTGFSRRANLRRHMDIVHKGMVLDDPASSAQSGSEVDSEDEMLGAVHVDGFLKPVVPSKGWRGEDMETRKRKRGRPKKKRDEETDESPGDTSA